MPNLSPDKPGIVKRVDTLETQVGRLEAVRDDMMGNVERTQYLHALRHAVGGADPLSPLDINAADRAHSHAYTDITNIQDMLNAFSGLDLHALAAALAPLIKPYIGGTARKVGEYGAWKMNYNPEYNPFTLGGFTPGKRLFIVGLSNQGDVKRTKFGVGIMVNVFPSIGGIWTGAGRKYPKAFRGAYNRADSMTFNPAESAHQWVISQFDAVVAAGSGMAPAKDSWQVRLANDGSSLLLHSSVIRVLCGRGDDDYDDYPLLEFWEY